MKKLLTAAVVALSFAGTVSADPIFIDNGVDVNGSGSTQTSWFDSLQFTYASQSLLTDVDGDGVVSIDDTIVSNSGMALGQTAGNVLATHATNLLGLGFGDDNGFWNGGAPTAGQWGITFGFTDISGVLTNTGFQYNAGTINLYAFDAAAVAAAAAATGASTDVSASITHLFDLNVATGGDTGNSTVFSGDIIDFFGPDTFNIAYGNGSETFSAAALLPGGLQFLVSNDTQGLVGSEFAEEETTLEVSGQHEGSVTFNVPEPTSIAILGLGLLGFAGARRRKS